jgi:hypothetical protein
MYLDDPFICVSQRLPSVAIEPTVSVANSKLGHRPMAIRIQSLLQHEASGPRPAPAPALRLHTTAASSPSATSDHDRKTTSADGEVTCVYRPGTPSHNDRGQHSAPGVWPLDFELDRTDMQTNLGNPLVQCACTAFKCNCLRGI